MAWLGYTVRDEGDMRALTRTLRWYYAASGPAWDSTTTVTRGGFSPAPRDGGGEGVQRGGKQHPEVPPLLRTRLRGHRRRGSSPSLRFALSPRSSYLTLLRISREKVQVNYPCHEKKDFSST